ncbi:MAG: hypothetical protein U0V70_16225 [Terriglobia bacterium]
MHLIMLYMKWIMIVSGTLTCTMIYAAIAPQEALHSTFGESLDGQLAEIVVRNWGGLIALVGGMLIYGAYHVATRPLVLTVAGLSKIIFIGLVLAYGTEYLPHHAGVAIAIDLVMVVIFALYLVGMRRTPNGSIG